jgi:transposase
VVDSSSIEVSRRRRRAKTDRLDAAKLSQMLVRDHAGEDRLWKVVRVPSPEEEDLRHLHRELITLRRECGRATSRIKGLLATQGVHAESGADLDQVRCWDGSPLPAFLLARARAEEIRLKLVRDQVHLLEKERMRVLKNLPPRTQALIGKLMGLKGVGIETAWLLVMEFFGWRRFANLKQLGALAGLAPTPHQSGELSRELGISKSGNRLVRWILVEAAWSWLKWQPGSELSRWYEKRFGDGSKRMRRIGCVALARKLLCALWKYVEMDQLPTGAILKA